MVTAKRARRQTFKPQSKYGRPLKAVPVRSMIAFAPVDLSP